MDTQSPFNWDGFSLVLDETSAEKFRRPYLSVSSATSFDGCPARSVAEKMMPRDESLMAATTLGTTVHEVFEIMMAQPQSKRTKADARLLVSQVEQGMIRGYIEAQTAKDVTAELRRALPAGVSADVAEGLVADASLVAAALAPSGTQTAAEQKLVWRKRFWTGQLSQPSFMNILAQQQKGFDERSLAAPQAADRAWRAIRHLWLGATWIRAIGEWSIEKPERVIVRANEFRFDNVKLNGVPMMGFIDRVDVVPDEKSGGGFGFAVSDYKGLAVDTPLPTPTGWTTMGDVQIGDKLIGSDGLSTTVTVKSQVHNRPCYQITFLDGSTVVCDNVHLWQVTDISSGKAAPEVLGADDLYARWQHHVGKGKRHSLVIPNMLPLELPDQELPLDPWMLGFWLGDGTSKCGALTVGDADLDPALRLIEAAGFTPTARREHTANAVSALRPHLGRCPYDHDSRRAQSDDMCVSCRTMRSTARRSTVPETERSKGGCAYGHVADLSDEAGRAKSCSGCHSDRYTIGSGSLKATSSENLSLGERLSAMGLLRNKNVPAEYLRSSKEQRIALLQGLMDSDGHYHPKRKRAVFVTTIEGLARATAELVRSLGVNVQYGRYEHDGTTYKPFYRVEFSPVGFNPFRLPRKREAVEANPPATVHAVRRVIASIEPTTSVPTQCVKVDASDSLYACGESMVMTHNTGSAWIPRNPREVDDKARQIHTYAGALRNHDGILPVAGRLLFTKFPGTVRNIPVTAEAVDDTLDWMGERWAAINAAFDSRRFLAKENKFCKWCPVNPVCPTFQRNNAPTQAPAARSNGSKTTARPKQLATVGSLLSKSADADDGWF